MESAVAFTDRIQYGVKPSSIKSENYLHNIKGSNAPSFDVQMGQEIMFDVTLTTVVDQASGTTVKNGNVYVRFERS